MSHQNSNNRKSNSQIIHIHGHDLNIITVSKFISQRILQLGATSHTFSPGHSTVFMLRTCLRRNIKDVLSSAISRSVMELFVLVPPRNVSSPNQAQCRAGDHDIDPISSECWDIVPFLQDPQKPAMWPKQVNSGTYTPVNTKHLYNVGQTSSTLG